MQKKHDNSKIFPNIIKSSKYAKICILQISCLNLFYTLKCIYYHSPTLSWIQYGYANPLSPEPVHNAIEYMSCMSVKSWLGVFLCEIYDISVFPSCPNIKQLMIMNEIVYSLHVCGPQAVSYGSGDDLSGIREERGWWFNFVVIYIYIYTRLGGSILNKVFGILFMYFE